ncbi:hypothetical protein JCM17380_18510 [Desulfosporosinus burensis]
MSDRVTEVNKIFDAFTKIGRKVELTPIEVGLRIILRDNEQKAALERGANLIYV